MAVRTGNGQGVVAPIALPVEPAGRHEAFVGEFGDGLADQLTVGPGPALGVEMGEARVDCRRRLHGGGLLFPGWQWFSGWQTFAGERCQRLVISGVELNTGAERQMRGFLRQVHLAVVAKAHPAVERMDTFVADIGFDDHAFSGGIAEHQRHHAAEHAPGEAGDARFRWCHQHVHTPVAGAHVVMRADGIVLRLVALDQKGGAAFEKAQIALAVRTFMQSSIERRHLLAAVAAHAPEAGVVAADPVMNQGAVRIAVDGA